MLSEIHTQPLELRRIYEKDDNLRHRRYHHSTVFTCVILNCTELNVDVAKYPRLKRDKQFTKIELQ